MSITIGPDSPEYFYCEKCGIYYAGTHICDGKATGIISITPLGLHGIEVHLKNQSFPIVYENVKNAYEKGGFYCVYLENDKVYKYPLADIFRVVETYK